MKSLDLINKRAFVSLLNYPHHPIIACDFTYIVPLALQPNSKQYSQFVRRLAKYVDSNESKFHVIRNITDEDEYNAMLQMNISDIRFLHKSCTEVYTDISANVYGFQVNLESFQSEIDKISCHCFYWTDHWHERKICRHIAATILALEGATVDKLLKILIKWKRSPA